jgi:hypothetical protein
MKFNYKKSLKFVTLIIASLLIATASAAIYNYMYIEGSVTFTSGTGLKWIKGADAPPSTSIAGSTVTLPFTVQNGSVTNYTACLYVQNLDASPHSLNITVTTSATDSYYVEFNMFLFYANQTQIDVLNVLTSDSYTGSIGASATWRLTFEIVAEPTSTSGSDTFNLQFTYL